MADFFESISLVFPVGPKTLNLAAAVVFLDYKMASKNYDANMLISCLVTDGHLIMDSACCHGHIQWSTFRKPAESIIRWSIYTGIWDF